MDKIKVRKASVGGLSAFGLGGDFRASIQTWTEEDARAAHAAVEEFFRERFEVVPDPHNPPDGG